MTENSRDIIAEVLQMTKDALEIQKEELKDTILTAADWAKRKQAGEKVMQQARCYALDAERKLGQILIAMKSKE